MFTTDEPVTEAALRRAEGLRTAALGPSGGSSRNWGSVPSPAIDAASLASSLAHQRRCAVRAAIPPVSALSSLHEVRQAYPAPPAAVLTGVDGVVGTASPALAEGDRKKRARAEAQAAAAAAYAARLQATQQAEKAGGAAAAQEPAMLFAKDYETVDYMGRSFLEPPAALVQSAPAALAKACSPPQTLRGAFRAPAATAAAGSGASSSSSGVQLVRWAPPQYGHLLFAANLQGEARLWEAQGSRKHIASFDAHRQPVKSLEVTTKGDVMSTGSVDGTAVLWDVEAGACKAVLTNPEGKQVVQHTHHPSDEDALVLVAVDKTVTLYDIRASHSRAQREYTGHMGSIFNLTLLSGGTKFLTTAEDRTLRTWDFRIPVQIKQFADANMHAITHVVHHPTEDYLAAQSLDNKIIVFKDEGAGKLKLTRQKEFSGHTTSGTRCQLAFSHDGQLLSSGDIEGGLFIWRWSSGELVKTFKAHTQMLVTHQWHPLEASRVVTAGWDGHIKNWA